MGIHTVPLAQALQEQGRRLVAFEPQPVIFQQLCANLALNGLMNVTAWPFACVPRRAMHLSLRAGRANKRAGKPLQRNCREVW
jgi:FkbM family methyltransferase